MSTIRSGDFVKTTYQQRRTRLRRVGAVFGSFVLVLALMVMPGAFADDDDDDRDDSEQSLVAGDITLTQGAGGGLIIGGVTQAGDDDDDDDFDELEDGFSLRTAPGTPFDVAKRIKAHRLYKKLGQAPSDAVPAAAGRNAKDYTGDGIGVALIDTGVTTVASLEHSQIVYGPDFSFDDQFDSARNLDAHGHGTFLAGLIVATDADWAAGNTKRTPTRVLGMAPNATLVSVKVGAADGAVDVTQIIAAIDWLVEHRDHPEFGVRVVNLSYGTDSVQPYQIDPLAAAVERAWNAGIVVVAAAGNDGEARVSNPAINPFVIAVGGAENRNTSALKVAAFTNVGSEERPADLFAPGTSVVGLRVPGAYADAYNESSRVGGELARATGTSQAAAVVSGAVALLLEQRPHLSPDQVKHLLTSTGSTHSADPRNPTFLHMLRALEAPTPVDGHVQSHDRSAGDGSIDESRGSVRVFFDGIALDGELDVFGNSWTGNSWTGNSWSGNSWSGNSWSGNSWTGNSWTGNSWTGNSWSGNSWSGNSWTGNSWTGNSWSGNIWSGLGWTGNGWN